ncbi:NlpC/P60 family protein [Streptomyces sp. NPDC059443]|uniref:NlpC/P60 family protein n=1 Tax=unclassified Streptomyces TaxID=2593676 RepID=UPI0036B03482
MLSGQRPGRRLPRGPAEDCTNALGADPQHWCDCSSLVQQAYRAAGVTIPRVTYDQVKLPGQVGLDDPKPGDLVFNAGSDGSAASPGHVGMYIGSGLLVESPRTGVRTLLVPYSSSRNSTNCMTRDRHPPGGRLVTGTSTGTPMHDEPFFRPWGVVDPRFWTGAEPEEAAESVSPFEGEAAAVSGEVAAQLAAVQAAASTDLARAHVLAEELDAKLTATYGERHIETVRVREVRAYLVHLTGRHHDTAVDWYLHVVHLHVGLHGPEHPETALAIRQAYSLRKALPTPDALRLARVQNELRPMREAGFTVISDRYLASSLVLQRLDGVAEQFVLDLHRESCCPTSP